MANIHELSKLLTSGSGVKLETEEGEFEGIFKQMEDGADDREIQLVKCVHMGKELPGVQPFSISAIENLTFSNKLDKNNVESNGCEINVKKSDNDATNNAGTTLPPKQKSRSKVKDRPVICKVRKKNIADISHLNNLHLLRMPELLEQIQMEDPTPLLPSKDTPGAFCIPPPEQDPEHMEGDKYKNRYSVEFTAARNQTWKDKSMPPDIHTPKLLFLIKDTKDPMFSNAVEQLRQTRTIAVSLEGQFLGRLGKLSLICFATPEKVYMFDVVDLGNSCFDMGLRQILEDSDIQKGIILKITQQKLKYNDKIIIDVPANF